MAELNPNFPFLLMPVRVQTRFIKDELWIRIFPDHMFLHSFEMALTEEEKKSRKKYLSTLTEANGKEVERKRDIELNAWKKLVDQYGVYRASWLAYISDESILNETRSEEEAISFAYKWLPDRFRVYLYYATSRNHIDPDNPKDHDKGPGGFNDIKLSTDSLPLLQEGENWLVDFKKAEEIGLAYKMQFSHQEKRHFERLIIVGFNRDGAVYSANEVRELLQNHQYSKGFSFLDYGTPTNNLKESKSGFSSREYSDAKSSFPYAAKGLSLDEERSYGNKLAKGMGLKGEDFKHVAGADTTFSRLQELLQKATWFAMGGHTLRRLFGDNISNEAHEYIWKLYSEHVKAKGNFPSIRIDDQPYGVCPIMGITNVNYKHNIDLESSIEEITTFVLARLFREWKKMVNTVSTDNKTGNRLFNVDEVPRIEHAESPQNEMVAMVSMEPQSSQLLVHALKLERQYGLLPSQEVNNLTTPQDPYVYSPLLLKELLTEKQAETKEDLTQAEKAFKELYQLFIKDLTSDNQSLENIFNDLLPQPQTIKYNSLFSLEDEERVYNPSQKISEGEIKDAPEESRLDLKHINLPFVPDKNWFLGPFKNLLNTIDAYLSDFENNKIQTGSLLWYDLGKSPNTYLSDLIVQGMLGAINLYYRDVYFQPDKDNVKGIKSYHLATETKKKLSTNEFIIPEKEVEKGEVVLHLLGEAEGPEENPLLKIKAPFKGKIEEIHLVDQNIDGQTTATLQDHGKLFRIIDKEGYIKCIKQLLSLGKSLVNEVANLSAAGLNLQAALEDALYAMVDLNSHRLDAWITGLADMQLKEFRSEDPEGVYFGAYGWVEYLKPDVVPVVEEGKEGEKIYLDSSSSIGGIIHTPNIAQATAAAMFKESYMNHRGEKNGKEEISSSGNPFTINLTSDRIKKSNRFLEGIRQDQEGSALLGYRMERFLHEAEGDELIYLLRRVFPMDKEVPKVNVSTKSGLPTSQVINGEDLIDAFAAQKGYSESKGPEKKVFEEDLQEFWSRIEAIVIKDKSVFEKNAPDDILNELLNSELVQQGVAELENMYDGSLDLLFYEAAYQMSQGNFSQAAAALDATTGDLDPPIPESLKTQTPGVSVSHKLIMLFEPFDLVEHLKDINKGADYPQLRNINPRRYIEPVVENWLEKQIGELGQIRFTIHGSSKSEPNQKLGEIPISLSLADLKLGYLELLDMVGAPLDNDSTEIEQRIVYIAKQKIKDKLPDDFQFKISSEEIPDNTNSLADALETLRYVKSLLATSRPLKAQDMSFGQNELKLKSEPLLDLKNRITKCVSLLSQSGNLNIETLTRYNIENARGLFFMEKDEDKQQLQKRCNEEANKKAAKAQLHLNKFPAIPNEIDVATFDEAFKILTLAARELFGKDFPLIPPAQVSKHFSQYFRVEQKILVGTEDDTIFEDKDTGVSLQGGEERIRHWINSRTNVNKSPEVFQDYLMTMETWVPGNDDESLENPYLETNYALNLLQYPTKDQFPWVGLANKEVNKVKEKYYRNRPLYPIDENRHYPANCTAYVIYSPAEEELKLAKGYLYGLMIDQFSELIPDEEKETGVTFHYDSPNSEPPQAILLAVSNHKHTNEANVWDENKIRDYVYEAMDLAKIRMIDQDSMNKFNQLLPMIHWLNEPTYL